MPRTLNINVGVLLTVLAALHLTPVSALAAPAEQDTAQDTATDTQTAEQTTTATAEETEEEEEQPKPKPRIPGFLKWLDPELNRARLATDLPARDLPRGRATALEELGRVAFRNPAVLGGWAGRAGMSCDTCHQNGGANKGFRLPPYSGAPGQIDMTQKRFNPAGDDRIFNPRPISDLRKSRAPYGSLSPQDTIEAFITYTITQEFGGEAPAPIIAKSLAAYVRALPDAAKARPEDDPLYRKLKKTAAPAIICAW